MIQVSPELRARIAQNNADIQDLYDEEKVPLYDEFVSRLFKPMANMVETVLHAAVGIAGEAGEFLDAVKKTWVYNKPHDCEHALEELGDLRFYYQGALNAYGFTDRDVKAWNMAKLLKRYPDGYTDAAAQARADKGDVTQVVEDDVQPDLFPTTPGKPEVRIENWSLVGAVLMGNAFGHPKGNNVAEGEFVRTSTVVSRSPDGTRIETRNTIYVLGKPA